MRSVWLLCVLAALLPLTTMAEEDDYGMKPYPAPEDGFQRILFRVPMVENEGDRKVEIIVGKMQAVDCNRIWSAVTWR